MGKKLAEWQKEVSGYKPGLVPLTEEEEKAFGKRRDVLQSHLERLEILLNNSYGNNESLRRVYEKVQSAFSSLTSQFIAEKNMNLCISFVSRFYRFYPSLRFNEMFSIAQEKLLFCWMKRRIDGKGFLWNPDKGGRFSTYFYKAARRALSQASSAKREAQKREMSLDSAFENSDGENRLVNLLPDNKSGLPEAIFHSDESRELLTGALEKLDDADYWVLALRYGLADSREAMTITDIGKFFGCARQNASYMHKRAIKRLYKILDNDELFFGELAPFDYGKA